MYVFRSTYFKKGLDKVIEEMVHRDGDPQFCTLIEGAVDKFLGARQKKKEEEEKAEQEKLEKERLRQEKIQKEREEKERREFEKQEKERLEIERQKNEKLEKQRLEKLEKERLENEERERMERERLQEMVDNESTSEDSDDESPLFEPILQASPPRVTREEIEEKFTSEMQEELKRLAVIQTDLKKQGLQNDEFPTPKDNNTLVCM